MVQGNLVIFQFFGSLYLAAEPDEGLLHHGTVGIYDPEPEPGPVVSNFLDLVHILQDPDCLLDK